MKTKVFNEFVEKELQEVKNVLVKKTAEYNLDEDRLSVFKNAANLERTTPEEALFGFVTKQIISIVDYIKTHNYNKEMYHDKCLDIINYMLLLMALVEERNEEK